MKSIFKIVAAAGLLSLPLAARADEVSAVQSAPSIAAQADAEPASGPVSLSELAQMSGGASPIITLTEQSLSATNSGNSVSAETVTTGSVLLAPGTFNGFNGVGNFVFNTGNNNNVQGSLSVTVVAPAAIP